VGITSAALILSPSVPGELHPVLGSAYFALSSAMACRVYRTLPGKIDDSPAITAGITPVVHATGAVSNPLDHDKDQYTARHESGRSSKLQINVEMDTRTDLDDGDALWARKTMRDDLGQDASRQV
jgi:hypothetical protein